MNKPVSQSTSQIGDMECRPNQIGLLAWPSGFPSELAAAVLVAGAPGPSGLERMLVLGFDPGLGAVW